VVERTLFRNYRQVADHSAEKTERLVIIDIAERITREKQGGNALAVGHERWNVRLVEQVKGIQGVGLRPRHAEGVQPHHGMPHLLSRLSRSGVRLSVQVHDHDVPRVSQQIRYQTGTPSARKIRGNRQQVGVLVTRDNAGRSRGGRRVSAPTARPRTVSAAQ
jgi:hypothetical protein